MTGAFRHLIHRTKATSRKQITGSKTDKPETKKQHLQQVAGCYYDGGNQRSSKFVQGLLTKSLRESRAAVAPPSPPVGATSPLVRIGVSGRPSIWRGSTARFLVRDDTFGDGGDITAEHDDDLGKGGPHVYPYLKSSHNYFPHHVHTRFLSPKILMCK